MDVRRTIDSGGPYLGAVFRHIVLTRVQWYHRLAGNLAIAIS